MRILHNQFSEIPGIAANSFSLPAISPLAGASDKAPAFVASIANQGDDFLGFSALHSATCCACGQEHQALKLYLAQADGNGGSGPLAQSSGTLYAEGDVPGDTSTTETIAVGGSVTDTIEVSGDQDWFAVELVAGQRYHITLTGTGTDPLDDPYLEVMDSVGNQVRFNDDSGDGLNSSLYFTPETSGTYYVNAHGWVDDEGVTSTGEYTITLEEAEPIGTYTFDEIANFITQEFTVPHRWDTTNLTYDVSGLSAGAQLLAIQALEAWEAITSLTFTEDTGNADITFQNTDEGAFANYAYAGTDSDGYYLITTATVNVAADWFGGDESLNSYTYQTFLHEIGHALGLGHAGPYNTNATYGQDNIYINDNWSYSVMSYFDQLETGFGNYRFALAPQIADIIAIQTLYGTNPDGTRAGHTTYGFNSTESDINDWSQFITVDQGLTFTGPYSYAIYDTGGKDTIDLSGYYRDQELSLVPETFSSVGDRGVDADPTYTNIISIMRDTIIENAIGGTGNDTITGNSANNTIWGNFGNDTIFAGVGADRLYGDAGDDSLSGERGADLLLGGIGNDALYGGNGNDRLFGEDGADILNGGNGNDNLNGGNDNDKLYGLSGQDSLKGGSGNDRLFGGIDDDTLSGDLGDDTLKGEQGADHISGGGGADLVIGGTEDDVISGDGGDDRLFGEAGNDRISGDAGFDNISGGDGDDLIFGGTQADNLRGGAGNDRIFGEIGNDRLIGDEGDDTINGGAGRDRIFGGTGNDVIRGAEDNDTISGDAGNDWLVGNEGNDKLKGGSGIDTLIGGTGGDLLLAGDDGDTVNGDAGNDRLFGEAGNDVLNGGAGDDNMNGGTGADVFVYQLQADSGNDVVGDFVQGEDMIRLIDTGYADFTALQAAMTQSGANTLITFSSGNTLLIKGLLPTDLTGTDFEFQISAAALSDKAGKVPQSEALLSPLAETTTDSFDFSGISGKTSSTMEVVHWADEIQTASSSLVESATSAVEWNTDHPDLQPLFSFDDFLRTPDLDHDWLGA